MFDSIDTKRTLAAAALLTLAACKGEVNSDGPPTTLQGNPERGQELFRFGTFGNEGFWSEAAGLATGIADAELTLRDALALGLQIDSESLVGGPTESAGGGSGAVDLDDPAVFEDVLRAGGILGLVPKDMNGDDIFDPLTGDAIGISCALCHAIVDGSILADPDTGGAIGLRQDGPAPKKIDLGDLFALADNSRALYPFLPQDHETIGGQPIGRTGAFAGPDSTEAEVDALLMSDADFPRGLWDMIPDGIGAPVVLPPAYDIRRGILYGVAGTYTNPFDLFNDHLTIGLDPTSLVTVPGAVFLDRVGLGIGTEIRGEYDAILSATGVQPPIGGFPYVDAVETDQEAVSESPVGLRIDLIDMRHIGAYMSTLLPPPAPFGDPAARARGEALYDANCIVCHADPFGVDYAGGTSIVDVYPNYAPTQLLQRGFPLTDALNDRLTTYDDRLVLFDRLFSVSQVPLEPRVFATPKLRGMHMCSKYLHDGSIASIDELLDPARGPAAPHPVYLASPADRDDVIEYLMTR